MKGKIDVVDLFKTALTDEQRKEAFKAYARLPLHERNRALQKIIEPAMPKIRAYTGQDNDLIYVAYLLEYVMNEMGEI